MNKEKLFLRSFGADTLRFTCLKWRNSSVPLVVFVYGDYATAGKEVLYIFKE